MATTSVVGVGGVEMEIWRYGDMEFWRYGDMEILEVRVRDDSSGSDERDGDRGWQ